jgi:hypothetical protein
MTAYQAYRCCKKALREASPPVCLTQLTLSEAATVVHPLPVHIYHKRLEEGFRTSDAVLLPHLQR